MTWVKANEQFFNLNNIGAVFKPDVLSSYCLAMPGSSEHIELNDQDAIALISAIEEMGIKDVSYSEPLQSLDPLDATGDDDLLGDETPSEFMPF